MSGRYAGARTVLAWLVALALLLPALAITLVRLSGSENGTAIRLVSFTPLALPLYLLFLVLALALVVSRLLGRGRRPRPRRTPLLLGVLVGVLGVTVHTWWLSPQFLGENPAPAPGSRLLTVMTSNLFEGKGDVEDVVRTVRDQDVDVLVLEEISTRALAAADAAGLAVLLPNRIGTPSDFDPVAGTMVFAKEPLGPPSRVATFHQSWLVDIGDLRVLAVHPVAPVTPAMWLADHAAILAAATQSRPDLILGDFNATPDHEPIQALDDAGFRDVDELANQGWQPTWPANGISPLPGVPLPPLVRIDHVLVGSSLAALETHTVEIPDSDHLGLVATLARR